MPEALARTGICEETIRCGLTDEAAASNQTQEVNIVYRKVDTNLNFVDREKEVEIIQHLKKPIPMMQQEILPLAQ